MAPAPTFVPQVGSFPAEVDRSSEPRLGDVYSKGTLESLPTLLTSGRGCAGAGSHVPMKRLSRAAAPSMLSCPEEPENEEEDADDVKMNFCVRNTFIDSAQMRSPSLERFYRERMVHSCPSSHVGRLRGLFAPTSPGRGPEALLTASPRDDGAVPWAACGGPPENAAMKLGLLDDGPRQCRGRAEPALARWGTATQPSANAPAASPPGLGGSDPAAPWCPAPQNSASAPPPLPCGPPRVLQLVEALADTTTPLPTSHPPPPPRVAPVAPLPPLVAPAGLPLMPSRGLLVPDAEPAEPDVVSASLGDLKLPSVGSAGHATGRCKPCAFAYSKGCENGATCRFCHLCEPGEKKRRQKEKQASRKAAVKAREAMSHLVRSHDGCFEGLEVHKMTPRPLVWP